MSSVSNEGGQRTLLIGWASRDITPSQPVNVIGQLHARVSDRVIDPLTVTALALSDDEGCTAALMVSADIAVVEEQVLNECRRMLKDRLAGFDPDHLILNATHTHNAPAQVPLVRYPPQAKHVLPTEAYTQILVQGICDAAAEAWSARKPGVVSWGCAQAVVGFNRRITYLDGASKTYGKTNDPNFSHVEGYEDHDVDMLFTYAAGGQLTGMVINLACPSQVTEGVAMISADFWHDARVEIRKRHGSGLFVLPQCSAAGDQSPHRLTKMRAEARMLALKGLVKAGEDTRLAERVEIGRRIAGAVDEAMAAAAGDIRPTVVFRHTVARLELPRRLITDSELESAREIVRVNQAKLETCDQDPASREYSGSYVLVRRFQNVIARYELQRTVTTLPVEVHIIRLGDIAFATNRFEYFLDYGVRIKARSHAIQTFVVQLAGEGSYLPTERALRSKSYGATIENNLVTPEGGQLLVNESVRLINELFA